VKSVSCNQCGQIKEVRDYQFKNNTSGNFYCNMSCFARWRAINNVGAINKRFTKVLVSCTQCGQPKQVKRSRAFNRSCGTFCDQICFGKWLSEHRAGEQNPTRKRYEVSCIICGKKEMATPYRITRRKAFACPGACLSRLQSQMRWKGGHAASYKRSYAKLKASSAYRVHARISAALRNTLRRIGCKKNGTHWETLLGYTRDRLMSRLTRTLPSGYTWNDFLAGTLHIDHITPVSAFNFKSVTDLDFKRCWALKNLRLLPAKENMRKGAKLTAPHQPGLAFG